MLDGSRANLSLTRLFAPQQSARTYKYTMYLLLLVGPSSGDFAVLQHCLTAGWSSLRTHTRLTSCMLKCYAEALILCIIRSHKDFYFWPVFDGACLCPARSGGWPHALDIHSPLRCRRALWKADVRRRPETVPISWNFIYVTWT